MFASDNIPGALNAGDNEENFKQWLTKQKKTNGKPYSPNTQYQYVNALRAANKEFHVSAWSKGGATTEENCQMLCKTHNRAKGNR